MSTPHQRAKKARRGDRSFQPSSAGKGDADRTTDKEAFDRNYDEIDWHKEDARIAEQIVKCWTREKKETPSLMTNILEGPQ